MTVVEKVDAAGTLRPPRSPVRAGFAGRIGDYWRLMIRGAVLQAITLGIYRFWLFTDMRRFLWAATRVADETLEYTGTAAELLLGFLIAIGILIPVYALFFLASLEYGMVSKLSGIVAFVVLAAFGQYAAFRARRYRLTRTVFRGLRFHQTGSAVLFAARAMLWWIPIVLTLGLAWPWATANLERYKMRHTFYGHLGGSFAGSGTRLFGRGIVMWLVVVGPLAGGLGAGVTLIDWDVLAEVLKSDQIKDWTSFVGLLALKADDTTADGIELLAAGLAASALAVALLYPVYQAMVMRWWLGGLRLGEAAAASDLRLGRYYGAYARYGLCVALFSIASIAVVFVAALGIDAVMVRGRADFLAPSPLRDGVLGVAAIGAYVVYALGISTIYQVVLKLRLWQAAVESTLISGYGAFDHVHADEAVASPVGEGLADALGDGGI